MPASESEWLDQHWDRTFAHHTAQVDTAKVLVTFGLGISATIVATALQVDPQNGWDQAAVVFLALAFVGALAAFLLDRLHSADRKKVFDLQATYGWTQPQLLLYVRGLMNDLEDENERVVGFVRIAAACQVVLSSAAAAFAVVSLFQ